VESPKNCGCVSEILTHPISNSIALVSVFDSSSSNFDYSRTSVFTPVTKCNDLSASLLSNAEIIDNVALHRFELHELGETAFLVYERMPPALRLIHTEVPVALRGKGIGSRLVAGVIKFAKQNGLKVVPLCPFVIEFLKGHPEHLGT